MKSLKSQKSLIFCTVMSLNETTVCFKIFTTASMISFSSCFLKHWSNSLELKDRQCSFRSRFQVALTAELRIIPGVNAVPLISTIRWKRPKSSCLKNRIIAVFTTFNDAGSAVDWICIALWTLNKTHINEKIASIINNKLLIQTSTKNQNTNLQL